MSTHHHTITKVVKLDSDTKERLDRLGESKQRSPHWIMREAIREYVDREEAREKFKQEALLSWENFQETGRHLTHQEISDWLDTWGTNRERGSQVPQIIITEEVVQGIEHCRLFLREKNLHAALRAAQAIKNSFALLQAEPEIGRPVGDLLELRELIIPFGESGYVALYRYEIKTDSLYMLAFRHQKEVGYEQGSSLRCFQRELLT